MDGSFFVAGKPFAAHWVLRLWSALLRLRELFQRNYRSTKGAWGFLSADGGAGALPLYPTRASAAPYSTFASRFRLRRSPHWGTHSQQCPVRAIGP